MVYLLSSEQDGRRRDYPLRGARVSVGRDLENDIVLDDASVSRRHARLEFDGRQWRVVDLRSRNGVFVNGLHVEPGESGRYSLGDGDVVVFGVLPLRFTRDENEKVVMEEVADDRSSTTTMAPVSGLNELMAASGVSAALPREAREVVDRVQRILTVVAAVGQRIAAVKPFDEIIEAIIDLVFESTPAQHAALLLWDSTVKQLLPKVVRARDGLPVGELRVSRSVVSYAFEQRRTVQLDPGFVPGESISRLGLRSAAAVPLWDGTRVIGVIYADSSLQSGIFDSFSLSLLSALANYAAIAIEHSRLLQRIQQEERARERLGRYHSPAVVTRILAVTGDSSSSFTLGAQEAEVTVLFSDMVGFTETCTEMEPSQVMLMLNQYFARLTEVIFEHEGTLDKYIGDCIMAVFGAPLSQPDHARRAALTALGMRDVVQTLNRRRTEDAMTFRTGLNSGSAVSGDVGGAMRKEWTVLGSTVNLASRMQSCAKPGQIVLSDSTRALLGDEFVVRSLGFQLPKGFPREIELFELIGLR